MRTRCAIAGAVLFVVAPIHHATGQSICEPAGSGRGSISGVVQDSVTRLPLQSLDVVMSWEENGGRRRTQQKRTDSVGQFVFCDVPAGTQLRLEAQLGRRAFQTVEVDAGGSRSVELLLTAPKSAVSGRVIGDRDGRGIPDVDVRVRHSNVRAVTKPDGSFQLADVPAGLYWLEVSHLAYTGRQDSVRVRSDGRTLLTIRLAESVLSLRPIEVNVRSFALERSGFYERRDRGFGSYLTRHEFEVRMPRQPTDLLRSIAGVRVVPRRDGIGSIPLDRSNCAFRYVLDGVRVSATFQIDDIPVEWIEALEVYKGASTVPSQFTFPTVQARANCGVIVIWTRRTR